MSQRNENNNIKFYRTQQHYWCKICASSFFKALMKLMTHLFKISCRWRYYTSCTHDRFSNKRCNLDKKKHIKSLTKYIRNISSIYISILKHTVSGSSFWISSSKLLANLVENSSSVSPGVSISMHDILVKL